MLDLCLSAPRTCTRQLVLLRQAQSCLVSTGQRWNCSQAQLRTISGSAELTRLVLQAEAGLLRSVTRAKEVKGKQGSKAAAAASAADSSARENAKQRKAEAKLASP